MAKTVVENVIKRAVKCRHASQLTEAMAILLDLHKTHPHDARVNYELACTYEGQGMGEDAVGFYERAIESGLQGADLRGCLLGLGSTYRCLEQYSDSVRTLQRGLALFPDAEEFKVFLALSLYNLGQNREAVSMLLTHIAEYTRHAETKNFRRAILQYGDQPDPPYDH